MSDDALIAWLDSGCKPDLSPEEVKARRCAEFSARFAVALKQQDLGPTQELHDVAMSRSLHEIHDELRAFGIDEYSDVWQTLTASQRSAIRKYLELKLT
jgi:hypothetical protein